MLTVIQNNAIAVKNGNVFVDRKFVSGMKWFANKLSFPITTVHPSVTSLELVMDGVWIPLKDLGFNVMCMDLSESRRDSLEEIAKQISRSRLVYTSMHHIAAMALKLSVPYILMRENELGTQLAIARNSINSSLRGLVRVGRVVARHFSEDIRVMRGARVIHCNGFPVYDESLRFNSNCLLYLDSRVASSDLISDGQLNERLIKAAQRKTLRVLYSGRYERIKGVLDALRVVIECQRMGLDIEFHAFGQGSLQSELNRIASFAPIPGKIYINDAIPFPQLVDRSREFDLFLSCHIQADPSCTYLETFGAGLPIVGYGNKMFERLCEVSNAGVATRIGKPRLVADQIAILCRDRSSLVRLSRLARSFCADHTFEKEFSLRADSLQNAYAEHC